MEILSDILKSLRVSGSVYFCDQFKTPWRKEFPSTQEAGFHLVRRGFCWVIVDDHVEHLAPGDLVFLGPGVAHTLTSEAPEGGSFGQSDNTLLLCGYCNFDQDTLTPLREVFPRSVIVRSEELHKHPWLKSTFDQLSSEYMAQNPGTEIIVNKLTEVVLVELIRINFGRLEKPSFLRALSDKRISKALEMLHSEPQQAWTVELLASEVGMSRAAFAKHFKLLVGEPMFAYLSQLRVQKAKEQLRTTGLSVDDIAVSMGYESERSFTKTFQKYVGLTPKQYRKAEQAS